jgi:hypothetical protein
MPKTNFGALGSIKSNNNSTIVKPTIGSALSNLAGIYGGTPSVATGNQQKHFGD